jgi:aminopeptidase N
MTADTPTTKDAAIHLADYQAPPFLIDTVHLDIDIRHDGAVVKSRLSCRRNPAGANATDLVLDGDELETLSVALDGRALTANELEQSPTQLKIPSPPDSFVLEIAVRIHPDSNTQLSGLYRSADGYFSQCEAQGFRRITWFMDRPDVMACYTVTVHADKASFPILLANGNPQASGDEADGRHFATWIDPFKKPSYLFAMVAAKLDMLKDSYRTTSGRDVQLGIYVEPGKLDQCPHAMDALKKSMRWDEQTFGLECDLDHYMIVAVGDFNMGAMENKGLNIFNTKFVLARQDTATDADFIYIDRVVAHEYFHNWTGNRVTCRDWFQLSLKEGLTVFRDQQFGADEHNRSTSRINEVRQLRAIQFPEDAGPMSHPVRPSSYVEINNFYTATVYDKGAEVVRMIHTLIGKEAFRRGMDTYFARHDGQAVTCDDFVAAMAQASGFDFSQFMNWYSQAGTPLLRVVGRHEAATQTYTLTMTQSCAPSADQPEKRPYLIPVSVALFDADGRALPQDGKRERLLLLTEMEQQFVFKDVASPPVPSLLRDFTAPVILDYDYSDAELMLLLAHDDDAFNRWEATQRLFGRLILAATDRLIFGASLSELTWPHQLVLATRRLLADVGIDPAYKAEVLSLPSESTLAEQMVMVDPENLHLARCSLIYFLASNLATEFAQLYASLTPTSAYQPDSDGIGQRRLRNVSLSYLNELDNAEYRHLAQKQFEQADNMTDQFSALSVLANIPGEAGRAALAKFYSQWKNEALVVDKWLAVQSGSRLPNVLAEVERLIGDPAFDIKNPNKVYSLIRNFGANHRYFHAADGNGYRFMARQIVTIDKINPQVAARLARTFDRWKRFDETHKMHSRAALESILQTPGLSSGVEEIVAKSFA